MEAATSVGTGVPAAGCIEGATELVGLGDERTVVGDGVSTVREAKRLRHLVGGIRRNV